MLTRLISERNDNPEPRRLEKLQMGYRCKAALLLQPLVGQRLQLSAWPYCTAMIPLTSEYPSTINVQHFASDEPGFWRSEEQGSRDDIVYMTSASDR